MPSSPNAASQVAPTGSMAPSPGAETRTGHHKACGGGATTHAVERHNLRADNTPTVRALAGHLHQHRPSRQHSVNPWRVNGVGRDGAALRRAHATTERDQNKTPGSQCWEWIDVVKQPVAAVGPRILWLAPWRRRYDPNSSSARAGDRL